MIDGDHQLRPRRQGAGPPERGLQPFVERELHAKYGKYWITTVTANWQNDLTWDGDKPRLDAAALLKMMWDQWNDVFRETLGQSERTLVSELRDVRNRWAHQNAFSGDDTYRALDSAARLLTAISAGQADEITRMKTELLRLQFDEQVRSEKRKSAGTAIESTVTGGLKPWREIVTPHRDVASGRYQQAEFAADLWQVHLGEGTDEYRDPVEFYRRTYLTESLKQMLVGALRRLSGQGGDPVVQLQTNFGGGKTHSMLALYHLFSGDRPEAAGRDRDGAARGRRQPTVPAARRVVLVGNKISPGNPQVKKDGTVVRTLWGELAWQLGGRAAYDRVAADDERATSPGDVLRELFVQYGPCLILIDEWVAYARQLHEQSDLPGRQLRDAVHLRPGADRVGQAGAELPTGHQPPGFGHDRLAAHPGGRRGGGRAARPRGARPAAQRGGPRRVVLAAGQRGGRVRDRAAAPVRAADRPGAVQGPGRRGARVRRPVPDAAPGVPARVPGCGLREAHPGRVPHPPGDLRPALHGLVDAGQVPAHARRIAPDGRGHPQPVGQGGPQQR